MLKTYFTREHTCATYSAGPAGPYLDDFIPWLEERGFTTRTVRRCLLGATQFASWAEAAGIAGQRLDATILAAFHCSLAQHGQLRYASGNPTARCLGAQHFLTFLNTQGIVSASAAAASRPTPPALLVAFRHWMHVHRGVTEQTLRTYSPMILDLLTTLGERPAQEKAKGLRAFVLTCANRHGKGKAKNVVTVPRMFVRFLIATGRCTPGLDAAIPTIALWRLATLPQYLPVDDVAHIISACDPSTPLVGARDRAIILLMAPLGLRGSDVVRLRCSDLHWHDGTLVVSGKSRRETRLPLPQEVGDALWHSLECARPPINTERVFITVIAPWVPISPQVIRQTAARAIQRAGIRAPTVGARLFRHSAATAMLRQGASLQTIGDILRHTSIETTAVVTHTAIAWAEQAASEPQRHNRLSVVIRFARFSRAADPCHDIPPERVFSGRRQHPTPYIFTDQESQALLAQAARLRPSRALRPHTYHTLLALLAVTGRRISEALALRVTDVTPDGLVMRGTKFRKSRLVPLHATTTVALQGYLATRCALVLDDDHLFVSRRRCPLRSSTVLDTFSSLLAAAGLPAEPDRPRPRRMDLRHTFASRALETCPDGRDNIGRHRLALTTSMGHARVKSTYWYLARTPQLLGDIAQACATFLQEAKS